MDLGIRPERRSSEATSALGRTSPSRSKRNLRCPSISRIRFRRVEEYLPEALRRCGWPKPARNSKIFTRAILDNRYTTPAEPKNMGACPYCRSATLPSDTICYSCGRVLPKGDRGSYRLEQQFSKKKGNKDTTYLMANKPSRRGLSLIHI